MNTESAYEEHTDLVRALTRPGSTERALFEDYTRRSARHYVTGESLAIVSVGDPNLIAQNVRENGASAISHVTLIMDMQARQARGMGEDDPADPIGEHVGVIDPAATLAPPTGPNDAAGEDLPEQIGIPLDRFTDVAATALAIAPTFYVTADMCTVLAYAAECLDGTDLMPYHPAYPAGFVRLATPLHLPYGDGTFQRVDAFSWATFGQVRTTWGVGQAGFIWQYADRSHAREDREVAHAAAQYPSTAAWKRSPRLVQTVRDYLVTGIPVGQATETTGDVDSRRERMRQAWETASDDPTPTPDPWHEGQADPDGDASGAVPGGGLDVGRFQPYLAAFLLLLTQDISSAHPQRLSPYAQTRARSAGRAASPDPSAVTVVDLRQRQTPDGLSGDQVEHGSGAHRRLTQRHLVGAHWKWQPHGPARALRRRVFIAPYIRGPQDGTLVTKARVHRL